ncbi:MAG: VTT domain-containing protein [Acidobacteria bacterium]|nr:VTT domain-containing protein [Acidobacteriota bacterium]
MVQSIIEALRSIGPLGVVLIAILDSSFLSIPEINDIVVVTNVAKRPDLFFFWPLLTTAGSVIGCFALYFVARKGGQVFLHRWFSSRRVMTIERVFAQYGSLALIIPALLPPPTPFKSFVATAGALQFPVRRFILTVALARSVRYFGMGLLAVFYGEQVEWFITEHSVMVALIIIVVVSIVFFLYRMFEARLEVEDPELAAKNGRQCV